MKTRKAGRGTLRQYELTNLLFFMVLIVALGVVVAVVFRHYGTADQEASGGGGVGVIDVAFDSGSDIGMFILDTRISETTLRYRSRIDIPVTDDGFIKALFALPGVEEVTVNQKSIMLKKSASSQWETIKPAVQRIVNNHLHIHF